MLAILRYYASLLMVALMAVVTFVACSDSDSPVDPLPSPEQPAKAVHEMGFTCNFAETTRGVGDGEFNDASDNAMLKACGFGVYCWYTGSTHFDPAFTPPKTHIKDYLGENGQLLMNNQKVEWKDWNGTGIGTEVWGYTPKKYWPINQDELLTLRAYAPYTSYVMTDEHGMPQLPVVLGTEKPDAVVYGTDYHNGTQHDPLWGTGRLVLPSGEYDVGTTYGDLYDNITYQMSGSYRLANAGETRNGTIDWYFHHGMSCLMFSCTIIADPGCDKVIIKGIEIEDLYTQGLLSLSSPTASESEKPIWDERSGDMTVKFDGATTEDEGATWTPGDLAPIPDPAHPESPHPTKPYPFAIEITDPSQPTGPVNLLSQGLLIIPRNHATGDGLKVTITYTIDDDTESQTAEGYVKRNFEGNTKYTLGLKLTPATGGLDIDIVQSAFTPWSDGGTGEREVYNW